ncbi:vesicle coat component, partial [Rhizopus stolonifer]
FRIMASQKEEPTASFLFGDSAGDDPFSQLQQQQQPTPPKEEQPVATEKKVAGDASSLFGNSTAGVDLFFSSTAATANTTPQSAYPPTTNASSFFDQSQGTGSFFDDLNQQQPVSLTQAYDPTTYSQQEGIEAYVPNGYQQGAEAQAYDQQQQQQQQEWVEFDPNVHYYYDEQGGVHYYDPNTNQEYDMSQYGYDYQYDPQYAEYYSQQEYDPNAYAQQQQVYDTNTYAPVTQDQTENSYFDYSHQPREVTPTDNAVAKVPAQVQSEQTLDTQQYQQGDQYGSQQQNYQSYEPVSTETVSVDRYAPAEYNTQATDLQVQVPPLDIKDNGPSPSAPPQKAIVTLPSLPRSSAMSPGAQISSHRDSFDAKANSEMDQSPSKFVQEDLNDLDDLVFGGNKQPQVEDLDDLFGIDNNQDQKVPEIHHEADSILFGSELEQTTQEVASKPKEQDCSFAYELTENKKEEHQVEQHEDEQPSEDNAQAEQHAIISEESNHSAAFESQEANYEHQQASQETGKAFTQVPGFENQDHINYESVNQKDSQGNYESEQAIDYSPQLPEYGTQETAKYESQQSTYEAQEDVNHEPPQTDTASYEPYQTANYEPQQSAYEPQQTTSYEFQQTVSYEPGQSTEYEPQPLTGYEPEPSDYEPRYAVTLHEPQPAASREILRPPPTKYPSMPPAFPPAASIKSVSSPPPFSTMPPPRSNSITEPDRHQMTSPFRMIERSATVPPPMTERIASPRPQLVPCPDPACEGENKVKAKFCCECGRPLAGISRSTTPSAATMSSYDVMTFTRPQDEKKDACKTSLEQFLKTITGDVEERRRLVLNYIQGRLGEFEESKALLWKLVELMIQHHEDALGDGGQLDKSIIGLLSSHSPAGINDLDQLEFMLAQGDRQSACQFAVEHDMWAHALIIASIDPDQFKHIITQFIDRGLYTSQLEWKPQIADNKKSLRMLYSVFNGTGAASVAQFVKNAVEEEPMYTQKTLEGWKDALALVLANRSMNDQEAIHGLGNQLEQAGLTNESQLCYLLSPDLLGLGTAWSADLD